MLQEHILNYNMKVRIISLKNNVYDIKPAIWIKSIFMVLIGIETTRFGIGIGRISTNIYFGSFIFVLMAISGIIVVLILKFKQKEGDNRRFDYFKTVSIICASFFGVAFGLAIYNTIIYNLETLNLFLLAFLGIFWFITIYYGKDWKYKGILGNIIISISFSFGLIYGAALNNTLIPVIIYLFFGTVFLLQISKDLINDCKHIERDNREGYQSFAILIGEEKAQKLSMILDIIVILFLIIPTFPEFPNILGQTLYTIIISIAIIFLGIAAFLKFRMNTERKYYRIVTILLRIGMFLVFAALILANF